MAFGESSGRIGEVDEDEVVDDLGFDFGCEILTLDFERRGDADVGGGMGWR